MTIDNVHLTLSDRHQREMHARIMEVLREKYRSTTFIRQYKPLNVTKFDCPVWCGSFSWSVPSRQERYVLDRHAIEIEGMLLTPSELARTYLDIKYAKRKPRMTTDQWQKTVVNKPQPPLFSIPGSYKKCSYVDLDGAYWQIVKTLGWDVDYNPGKWLEVKSNNYDFPYWSLKMARNCLVSIGLPSAITLWTGHSFKQVKRGNRHINLSLWAAVQHVLNGVAADMVSVGAKYVFTDGYILQNTELERVEDVMWSWGMKFSQRHTGDAEILGPAAYKIGSHESKPFRSRKFSRNVNLINYEVGAFMRKRYKYFSATR